MMGVLVSIIWLGGMVMAALLLRDGAISLRSLASAALAYAAGLALCLWLSPQPNWVSMLLLLIMLWRVAKGPQRRLAATLAALCAALVSSLQISGGLEAWLAVILALIGFASFWILPRIAAPSSEGRLICAALAALAAGMASDFLYGWNAALVILANDNAQSVSLPNWTWGIIMLALIAGMIWGKMAKR